MEVVVFFSYLTNVAKIVGETILSKGSFLGRWDRVE